MRESFSLSPNSCKAYAAGRRMIKPSLILRRSYTRMKEVIYGVQDEAWGPLEMEVSKASGDHPGPHGASMVS